MLNVHTCNCVTCLSETTLGQTTGFLTYRFLSPHVPSQAIALANKEVEKVLKEGSGVDKTSTSPSQTHPRQLLRQMSYDSSFLFHSHSISIGSVFRLSFAHQRLSNHYLPYFFIYMVVSNTTIPFEKLFHGSSPICTFFPTSHLFYYVHVPRESRLPNNNNVQTPCCKIFVLKYVQRTWTPRKIFNTKIFPTKISYSENFSI